MRVDDAAVRDAELVETPLPLLQLAPVGGAEGDVVEAAPARRERAAVDRHRG